MQSITRPFTPISSNNIHTQTSLWHLLQLGLFVLAPKDFQPLSSILMHPHIQIKKFTHNLKGPYTYSHSDSNSLSLSTIHSQFASSTHTPTKVLTRTPNTSSFFASRTLSSAYIALATSQIHHHLIPNVLLSKRLKRIAFTSTPSITH